MLVSDWLSRFCVVYFISVSVGYDRSQLLKALGFFFLKEPEDTIYFLSVIICYCHCMCYHFFFKKQLSIIVIMCILQTLYIVL